MSRTVTERPRRIDRMLLVVFAAVMAVITPLQYVSEHRPRLPLGPVVARAARAAPRPQPFRIADAPPCGHLRFRDTPTNDTPCYLDAHEREWRRYMLRSRLDALLEYFDASCARSTRCRDDHAGQARVRDPLRAILDAVDDLDDFALSLAEDGFDLEFAIDRLRAQIPPNHRLLPAALPIDPYPPR